MLAEAEMKCHRPRPQQSPLALRYYALSSITDIVGHGSQAQSMPAWSVYTFRLKSWKECDEMVGSRMTADVACNKIYQAYGVCTSVTKILTDIKRDNRLGSWPASFAGA